MVSHASPTFSPARRSRARDAPDSAADCEGQTLMSTGAFIAIGIAIASLGAVALAFVMERRERKKLEEQDLLGLDGRTCRRRRSQPRPPWWFR
jgi:hypothetical protein